MPAAAALRPTCTNCAKERKGNGLPPRLMTSGPGGVWFCKACDLIKSKPTGSRGSDQ